MVSVMQLLLEPNEFEFCATENRVSSVEHIVFFTNVRCAKSATTVHYFFNTTLHDRWDLMVPR